MGSVASNERPSLRALNRSRHRDHAPALRGVDLDAVLAVARTALAERPRSGPELRTALCRMRRIPTTTVRRHRGSFPSTTTPCSHTPTARASSAAAEALRYVRFCEPDAETHDVRGELIG